MPIILNKSSNFLTTFAFIRFFICQPGYAFAFPTFLVAMAEAHGNGKDFGSFEVIYTAGVALTPAIRQSLKKLPNLQDIVVVSNTYLPVLFD